MFSIPYLCICVYCMLQLCLFIIMDKKHRNVSSTQDCYFSLMLIIILLSFTADIISSLYRGPIWIFPFAAAGNYFEIILNTVMLPIYFLYACSQISNIDMVLKRRIYIILNVLATVCIIIVISTVFTKQIFYFDQARLYHRGRLFWLPMSILFAMMLIIEGFIINQKSKIEARYYLTMIFFLVIPMAGWVLQLLIYGLPFSLISISLAAQIVFINIQNRKIATDYLTGVFNREELDTYIQNKINTATENHSFSAIMIDIDDFKSINDRFGHNEGDAALSNTVNILSSSIKHSDFIARYGGDEFCIIVDANNSNELEGVINHINSNLLDFNKKSEKPYKLVLSMGYEVYNPLNGSSTELLLKTIDKKMYGYKKLHKNSTKVI